MIDFLDGKEAFQKLKQDIRSCSIFRCAISYIRESGMSLFTDLNPSCIDKSQIITCADFGITEATALGKIIDFGIPIRVTREPGLHSKLWLLFFDEQRTILYVGSSNLTIGGFNKNIEANIRTDDLTSIQQASYFLDQISQDDVTFKVTKQWVSKYIALQAKQPLTIKEKYIEPDTSEFSEPAWNNAKWYTRTGSKTFLTQGIFSDIANACSDKSELLGRVSNNKNVLLILLEKEGDVFRIFKKLEATLNLTNYPALQIGKGRKEIGHWISKIFGFPFEESKRNIDNWHNWLREKGWQNASFDYEIFVDLKETLPKIYARPK